MIEVSNVEKVEKVLLLSRHFGGGSGIKNTHRKLLVEAGKAIDSIGLKRLLCHWTVYTLQHESKVLYFDSEAHVVFDLAELDPIKSLGLGMLPEVSEEIIADVFIRAFIDEFLLRQDFGMAYSCLCCLEKRKEEWGNTLEPSSEAKAEHERRVAIIETIALCHEIGHIGQREGYNLKLRTDEKDFGIHDWLHELLDYFEKCDPEELDVPYEYLVALCRETSKALESGDESPLYREISSDMMSVYLAREISKIVIDKRDDDAVRRARMIFTNGMKINREIKTFIYMDMEDRVARINEHGVRMDVREIFLNRFHNMMYFDSPDDISVEYGKKILRGMQIAKQMLLDAKLTKFQEREGINIEEAYRKMIEAFGWAREMRNVYWDYVPCVK